MTFQRGYETDRCTIGTGVHTYSRDRTTELLLFKVSGHFVQRPFRTKETIWSPSYNDFLYEVVPGFLHTHKGVISYKDVVYENSDIFLQ